MPNILIAGRFIVLPNGSPSALISFLQGYGCLLRKIKNLMANFFRHIIKIFYMLIWDD